MSVIRPLTKNLDMYPSSYDSGYQAESVSNLSNAYSYSNSTTYATINIRKAASSETYIYYNFNISGIPNDAVINSVSCTVKCTISSTSSRVATKTVQLYSGNTAKGSAYTVNTSTTAFSLDVGSWTVSELSNVKLRLYAKRSPSNTSTQYYFRLYGATFTVSYTYNQEYYVVNITNSSQDVTVTPTYEEIFPGEHLFAQITGDVSRIQVTDNGVDVTSQLTPYGDDFVYYIVVIEDHDIDIVSVYTGNTVYVKREGTWVMEKNVYIKYNGIWQNMSDVYVKTNGTWTQQSDKSVIFDSNAVFERGVDDTWLWLYMVNGGILTLNRVNTPTTVTLEYSFDNGDSWTEWQESGTTRSIELSPMQVVHIRNTSTTQTRLGTDSNNYYRFTSNNTSPVYAGGNINSLLCKNPSVVTELLEGTFVSLFYGMSYLVTTPLMPALKIGPSAYMRVYRNCLNLTLVRSLDAEEHNGYAPMRGMFENCSSLESIPTLKIDLISQSGLREFLSGCTSLREVRTLMTNVAESLALENWMYNVPATGDFYCDSSLVIPSGASGIPTGWTRHNL